MRPTSFVEDNMTKMPRSHETATAWRSGVPRWWFGAPVIAFAYALATPRFLPDIVSTPDELSGALPAVRWLVGLVIGVGILTTIHLTRWVLSKRA